MLRLSMFSLKEGEPIFSNNFCDPFKIKKSHVDHSFSSLRAFKDPKTPSFRNIALGLNSVITEPTCKYKHKCEC